MGEPTSSGASGPTSSSATATPSGASQTPTQTESSTDGDTTGLATVGDTTDGDTTGMATTDVDTTGMAATEDTGMATDVDTAGDPELPPGLVGCTLVAPAGTSVTGMTGFGPFDSERAYFGLARIETGDGTFLAGTHLVLLTAEADPVVEFAELMGNTGMILRGLVNIDIGDELLGTRVYSARLAEQGSYQYPPQLKVTYAAYAGNWDEVDPDDPPRLVGEIEGVPGGSIDAVYCDLLDTLVDPHP